MMIYEPTMTMSNVMMATESMVMVVRLFAYWKPIIDVKQKDVPVAETEQNSSMSNVILLIKIMSCQ